MQDRVAESFHKLEQFYGERLFVNIDPWNQYSKISTKTRGVYVIYDTDYIYYVGKGQIKDRQKMHKEKLIGEFKYARDTLGFRALRESGIAIELEQLKIMWVELAQETLIGAVESSLIFMLQPEANDEVFKDRQNAL